MWRWPVVEKKKNQSNALRQKAFSIHAKLISIAAQKWWDPDKNPSLYDVIEKARKDNVPNDNIERAIKKWTWEDKMWEQISQMVYEWYAPGWVAVVIQVLTDNKNRTAANIRHVFSKFGWSMWEQWSVSWIFSLSWILIFDSEKVSQAKVEELVFETDAQDFIVEDDEIRIITSVENLISTTKFFKEKGFIAESSKLEYIPNNFVEVTEFDKALKIIKMMEALDEDEDVEDYSFNYQISNELQQEVLDFIEKNTFRT